MLQPAERLDEQCPDIEIAAASDENTHGSARPRWSRPTRGLAGPSGTGKTPLATALGMAACAQGRKVRFFRVTELITLLVEAKEEGTLLRLRHQLAKLDLLILDELG